MPVPSQPAPTVMPPTLRRLISIGAASALVLTVTDNGPGPVSPNATGEGLANTRKRLEELYRDDQQFDLRAGERGGAVVVVRLPFHTTPLLETGVRATW